MIIQVDEFFIQVLQRNGYDLNYEKIVNISKEASRARAEQVNKNNEKLIKRLGLNSIQNNNSKSKR